MRSIAIPITLGSARYDWWIVAPGAWAGVPCPV